jgi:hypothetical protein
MKSGLKMFGNILLRIVAVFTASGLSVIGAGAVAGISTIKAITVAGITAVAAVVEKLARGFMNDGKLDLQEINAAFAAVDVNSKTAADLQVEAKQNGTNIVIKADGTTESVIAATGEVPVPADKVKDPNYN